MKRVGIIGCGNISRVHIDALTLVKDAAVTAVCDIKPERLTEFRQKGIPVYTDYREMLLSGEVDTVHICTPHYLHSEMAVFALENGVDVLCEKPMAIAYEDALKMKAAADKSGSRLWIVFQNRFNPGARLIKDSYNSGALGKIKGAKCEVTWHRDMNYYSDDWHGQLLKEGGGVIINQAIHTLDMLRWLSGEKVCSVSANISNRALTEIEVEDTAEGIVRFENGAAGSFFFTNTYVTDSPVRLELVFEKGTAVINGATGEISFSDGGRLTADKVENYGDRCFGKDYWGVGHAAQIMAFYDEEDLGYSNLKEALKTQELLCAVYRSAREGREVRI